MNTIPLSDKPIKLNFPEFESTMLNDNLKFHYLKDETQNLVRIRFILKNGANSDKLHGISSLTSMMLHSGTSKYTADKLAERIEYYGSSLSVTHNMDYIEIETMSLSEFFQPVLDIICDVILDSQFPDDEFVKSKKKAIAELQNNKNDLHFLCNAIFNNTIFNGGYTAQLSGLFNAIETLTIKEIEEKYKQLINNTEISIIVVGNFEIDSTLKYLSSKFQHDVATKIIYEERKVEINHGLISAIDKIESNQCQLKMGIKSPDFSSPELPYANIINIIFGGFFQSRLNKILREEKGYTYGIGSILSHRNLASIMVVGSSVKIDKTAESINIILDTFRSLKDKPISEEELKIAIRYFLGSFLRQTEASIQYLNHINTIDRFKLDKNYFVDFVDKISAATLDDIHASVNKYFTDERFVISAAGDLNIIKPQLEEFGKVRIFELN